MENTEYLLNSYEKILRIFKSKLNKSPKFLIFVKWIKLILITGSAQIIVQATGLISGVLIVRLLPTNEYAFYTLANTMLGTMTVLADGGISSSVMAQGSKVWQDKRKLGSVLATGLDLRKKFALISLLVTVPVLTYLLLHHGASGLTTVLIILALIPAFFAALSDSLLEIVPKLHQDIAPLQKNQITVSIARLLLTGLTLFIFPWTFIAVISAGIPRIYGNFQLYRLSEKFVDKNIMPDVIIRHDILDNVKKLLPVSIYYCMSGQITIWLISIFGTTQSLASLGALSRLSAVFSIINITFSFLITPRFSRLKNRKIILQRFLFIQIVLLILCISGVTLVYFLSDYILYILGKDYYGLNLELTLISISSFIALISGCTNQLLLSKGLPISPQILLPSIIVIQLLLICFLPLNTIVGVICYGAITTLFIYLLRLIHFNKIIKNNELFEKNQKIL